MATVGGGGPYTTTTGVGARRNRFSNMGGFGRRRTATGTGVGTGAYGTTGTGTTGAGVGTGRRGFGRRKGGAAAVTENKVMGGPAMKFTDMRAASGRRMSVFGARISEKMAYIGADFRVGLYTISHPLHPVRRAAAKERAQNLKAAATERKRQKIARAADIESRKRAGVRENRAAQLNTAL